MYCALRRTYRLEQSRENLIAIFQRGHFVAFQQGWAEQISHRSDEDIVPRRIIGDNFVTDLLLRREKIPRDKERRRSANGGCAEHLRPLCRARAKRILHARVSHSAPGWFPANVIPRLTISPVIPRIGQHGKRHPLEMGGEAAFWSISP